MYVDDLICTVARSTKAYKLNSDDYTFVMSLSSQIEDGKTLTSRQAFAIRKVLSKYTNDAGMIVDSITPMEWKACLDINLWKVEPRVTVQKRNEARYLGDNLVGLSYQYARDLAQDITRLRAHWRNGVQIVPVNRQSLDELIDLLGTYRFERDAALDEYLALCMSSKDQMSHFILDGESVVCNVCDSDTLSMFLLHVAGAQRI